jgi:lipopolysaccharide biosynthesis glycosyltransferase
MLHSFLQYNQAFKIYFFTSFIMQEHINKVKKMLPLALKSEKSNPTLADAPGGSLWLQKQDQLRSHSR